MDKVDVPEPRWMPMKNSIMNDKGKLQMRALNSHFKPTDNTINL